MSELLGMPFDARLVSVLIVLVVAGLLCGLVGFGAASIGVLKPDSRG
ncbi:MAG TPA: hypothetical protein VG900_06000 [Hyphomicrobiaceae bacterium]|nr:hypothetical protein [Hyphomicrobiaceae bacterium]